MEDDRTIDEALAAEEAELASLEAEGELVDFSGDDQPAELVPGEALSLEEVLDTIFSILALHSTQLQAIVTHLEGIPEVPAERPTLHVVGDTEGE